MKANHDSRDAMSQLMIILSQEQVLHCYQEDVLLKSYRISSGKNGLGEVMGSERTPRGWHVVCDVIGKDCPVNSVFVGRQWTKEIYSEAYRQQYPDRDWILTRIIRLDGLEWGRNKGGVVDSYNRFIYLHGVPDSCAMGIPLSHGCIRMRNEDIVVLAEWVVPGAQICIV